MRHFVDVDAGRVSAAADELSALMWPAATALDLPVVPVDDSTAALIADGRSLNAEGPLAELAEGDHVAMCHEGRLLAVYERQGAAALPATVIPGGVR